MTSGEIKSLLQISFEQAVIEVNSDGYHAQVVIVSDVFEGLSALKRQQKVYAALNDKIADGSLHAVMMKLYTPEQWQAIETKEQTQED